MPTWLPLVSGSCIGWESLLQGNSRHTAVNYRPNDPMFGRQRALEQSAFPKAWSVARGGGVKVAVVDSGIDADHPDLANKIAIQKDFVGNDSVAEDDMGHGTHVAGTIAAATDNGKGIAGGCPDCRLLIAKAFGLSGGNAANVSQAIRWSANQGADVINVSFTGPDTRELDGSIDYAEDEGAIIVAASSNLLEQRSNNIQSYPAAYDNVLAVATAEHSNQSTWGLSITRTKTPAKGI